MYSRTCWVANALAKNQMRSSRLKLGRGGGSMTSLTLPDLSIDTPDSVKSQTEDSFDLAHEKNPQLMRLTRYLRWLQVS
jgi:hypothetical protein